MAAAAQIENGAENAEEEQRRLLPCGCNHIIGAAGDYFCGHIAPGQQPQQLRVLRYSQDEIMGLNPAGEEAIAHFAGVIVDADVLASLASATWERVDSLSGDSIDEESDSPRGDQSTESASESDPELRQELRRLSIGDLFNRPLSVRPLAVPVKQNDGRIPILPMCFFENVLTYRVDGDGFDIFRSPFHSQLVQVPEDLEQLLQFKADESPQKTTSPTENPLRKESVNVARKPSRDVKKSGKEAPPAKKRGTRGRK
uniref:DUF3846 domain-containing protein n=1 Tax=Steinernema glaseri TaxID=37863 RepID=A0A1I7YSU4_9BILA